MPRFNLFSPPRRVPICAAILSLFAACSVRAALADELTPVHLRVAGHECQLKTPALSDGKETYVPLDILKAVGATGKLNLRRDVAAVWTLHSATPGELAIARPSGKPMLLLSDLARLVGGHIERPDAKDANGKFLIGKRGDTVYLLAKVTEARVVGGALQVTTNFPVPYQSRTLKAGGAVKGYIDCLGATVAENPAIRPVPAGEKRVLRIRAGQNTVETVRIVIEFGPGATLTASASAANSETQISAGIVTSPVRVADNHKTRPKADSEIQAPVMPDEIVPTHTGSAPAAQNKAPDSVSDARRPTPDPMAPIRPGRPKSSRGSIDIRAGIHRDAPPVIVQGLRFFTRDAQRVRLEIGTSRLAIPYAHYQQNATQLVVDIPNASLKLPDADSSEQSVAHPLVSGLHAEQLAQTPPVTRITLDMNRVVGFSVEPSANKITLDLRVPRNATGVLADKLIVIDAGHGGSSSGAVGHGSEGTRYEKYVTLGIALKLRSALEACGARVVMTRDRDVDVDLYARPRLANDIRADLFVSIHNDSNAHPDSASGTSTYYHMSDSSSRALATCVQQAVSAISGLPSRGALSDGILYQNGLAVLRVSTMPAVLCEVAYINNSRDRRKLCDPDFQQKVAAALCRGIKSYVEGSPLREKTAPTFAPMPDDPAPPAEDTTKADTSDKE